MMREGYRVQVPDADWFRQTVSCQHACPAHTDVPRYVKLIAEGRFDDAYLVNQRANVFPEILGRICARPCEKACRRGRIDDPVAICNLKRSAGDHKTVLGILSRDLVPITENGQKVAIVGAGPAGLTAAQDLRKLGYAVTVYDTFPSAGGMLIGGIPTWRLPRDVVRREIDDYFAALGVVFRLNTVVGRDVQLGVLRRDYDAVYLAAGTQASQALQIPGEGLTHVYSGLEFMERVNLRPSSASVGHRVAVIGGGFTAMDCARSALRLGAEQVHVLYRRTKSEIPVDEYELSDAQFEGVIFHYLTSPKAVVDDGNGGVGGLTCFKNTLGPPDASRRPRPVPLAGSDWTLEVDTVISATGQVPDLGWLGEEGIVVVENGKVVVDSQTSMTRLAGLFAGGDFVMGARNAISAIADGHRAATAIGSYLSGHSEDRRTRLRFAPVIPYVMPRDYTECPRVAMPVLPLAERKDGMQGVSANLGREVETGYGVDGARVEASRCLLCYRNVTIDSAQCIMCSRCVEYCPYDCIRLVPLGEVDDAGGVGELSVVQLGCRLDGSRDLHRDSVGAVGDFVEGEAFILDEDYCIRCGICEAVCPTGALQIKQWELEEVTC